MSPSATPLALSEETTDALLHAARANDLPDLIATLQAASSEHSTSPLPILAAAADEYSLNTPLHYAAANGHIEILEYIGSLGVASSDTSSDFPANLFNLVAQANEAGNTPVHYAALNGNLEAVKILVGWLDAVPASVGSEEERKQLKLKVLEKKNRAGKDAFFEAVGYIKESDVDSDDEKEKEKIRNETEEQRRGREERLRKEMVGKFLLEAMGVGDMEEKKRNGEDESVPEEASENQGDASIQGQNGQGNGS